MTQISDAGATPQSTYAVLRRGGAPPNLACAQMALEPLAAQRLEAVFRTRATRGAGEEAQPRFARHEAHVAAVRAAGGFPALTERRRGRSGVSVGLPLVWPGAQG